MPNADGWNGFQAPLTPVMNGQQNRSYAQMIDDLEHTIRGISRIPDEVAQAWINTGVQRLCEVTAVNCHFALTLKGMNGSFPNANGVLGNGQDIYHMSDGSGVNSLLSVTVLAGSYLHATVDDANLVGTPYTPLWIEDTNIIDGLCYGTADTNDAGFIVPLKYPFSNITSLVINGTSNIVITVDQALGGIAVNSWIGIFLSGASGMNVNQLYQVSAVDSTGLIYTINGDFSSLIWIPSTNSNNGTSNGLAMMTMTNDVTKYPGGARIWRGDKVPSYVASLKPGQRTWNTITNVMQPTSQENMLLARENDTRQWKTYTDYSSPSRITMNMEGGQRYVQTYPLPFSDSIADIFGECIYPDTLYNGRPMGSQIKMGRGFERAIKEYVLYEYYSDAKDRASAQDHLAMFAEAAKLRAPVVPGVPEKAISYR